MPNATALDYQDGETLCKGVYYTPDNAAGTLPIVLICHAWDGIVQEVHDKAQKLASEGYIAFALDILGNGQTLDDMSQVDGVIGPLMVDRTVLLNRLQAGVEAAKNIPGTDTHRMGAMGYCFGGLCVLDLARAGGDDLKGVVSFHGALMPNGLAAKPISSKVLVLHGNDDPLVPAEQVAAFQQEMTDQGVDWQLTSYGNTVHAFTRPDANDPGMGAVYSETADRRSWQAMLNFFTEVL